LNQHVRFFVFVLDIRGTKDKAQQDGKHLPPKKREKERARATLQAHKSLQPKHESRTATTAKKAHERSMCGADAQGITGARAGRHLHLCPHLH
jgi:hypothetical protein